MVFTVPLDKPKEIAPLFNLIETNDEEEFKLDSDAHVSDKNDALEQLKKLVSDCGISHSTLEEVFMKVTGRKQPKYQAKSENRQIKPKQID